MAPINVLSVSTLSACHFGSIYPVPVISHTAVLGTGKSEPRHLWLAARLPESRLKLFQMGISLYRFGIFRLVRRLHSGVHLLYPDHNLHQTMLPVRTKAFSIPNFHKHILGGQILHD